MIQNVFRLSLQTGPTGNNNNCAIFSTCLFCVGVIGGKYSIQNKNGGVNVERLSILLLFRLPHTLEIEGDSSRRVKLFPECSLETVLIDEGALW